LPLKKYIDLPVFLFVNFFVDLEPLLIGSLFRENKLTHVYFHSLLFGIIGAIACAAVAYWLRESSRKLMKFFMLSYEANFPKMLISAMLGIWFHNLLDAFTAPDIYVFYPLKINPFFGLLSRSAAGWLYSVSFVLALLLYTYRLKRNDDF